MALAHTNVGQWDLYEEMKNHTTLPIILKGITTVEDALTAVERGVPAIWLSNHGARQVDHSPSPLEIAYEIYRNAPQVFSQVEVLADSGVRYGSDVLKLLALGVKAVGLGRPYVLPRAACESDRGAKWQQIHVLQRVRPGGTPEGHSNLEVGDSAGCCADRHHRLEQH